MKAIRLAVLLLACLGLDDSVAQNPVIKGFYPDPSVCRVGEDFYLVTSSFQFFPGVPLFHSKDLVNWEQIGNVLDRQEQLPLKDATCWGGIYAPTIRYNDGVFYMITTNCSSKGNFLVTTTDPRKGWSDPVWLKQGGIDPSLYFEDGKVWMVSNPNDGIYLCQIDPKTGEQLTESVLLWQGDGGRYPEAPHLYKKGEYYYLMIAEGGTELAHSETIARSKSIFGPYESNPDNPILTNCCRAAQGNSVQGIGHADLVEAADGSWWMVFLGHRPMSGANHNLGRETFLLPVTWKDGWPVVGKNGTVSEEMDFQTLPQKSVVKKSGRVMFSDYADGSFFQRRRELPELVYMRNPKESFYNIKSGKLVLTASADRLSDVSGSPVFVGRRQQDMAFSFDASMTLRDAVRGDEAGLTVFMTEDSHYDIFVTRDEKGRSVLRVRYNLVGLSHETKDYVMSSDRCVLRVSGDKEYYYFSFSQDDGRTFTDCGKMGTRYLSSECAGGFTGVMLGLYAQSANGKTKAKAEFSYLDYEGK